MVRVKAPKSKRKSSKQRHKIERKKREHKRDLKKAAKALKAKGLGPKRSKKTREMAKLALEVSNTHPEKERILSNVLTARELARANKRKKVEEEVENFQTQEVSTKRQILFFPGTQAGSFPVQFHRSLTELILPSAEDAAETKDVGELPSASYLVTVDSRFVVQSTPWSLLDAIVAQSAVYCGKRNVLLLFVFTKVELVSTAALVSQFSLLAVELTKRYPKGSFGKHLIWSFVPFSINHPKLQRHLIRVLNQFTTSENCKSKDMNSNLDNKMCAFVVGLPNTGRRSLCRILSSGNNQSSVSVVPLRAAQLQLSKENETEVKVKFAFPNAKSVTLILFPEDSNIQKELRNPTGGDIFFRSQMFVEKCAEPEPIACVLFEGIENKLGLFQAFCQPAPTAGEGEDEGRKLKTAERFLRGLGKTVRQEKGFHISPLFVANSGSMGRLNSSNLTAHVGYTSGQQQSRTTLLDATYSNATPSKLVRISSVIPAPHKRGRNTHARSQRSKDSGNIYRLGARTFIRELYQGRHVPWAVMRAPSGEAVSPAEVTSACALFNLSILAGKKLEVVKAGQDHLNLLISALSDLMKDVLVFLPHDVVEMYPDTIAPPQYSLESEDEEEEAGDEADEEDESGSEVIDGEEDDEEEEDEDDEDESESE